MRLATYDFYMYGKHFHHANTHDNTHHPTFHSRAQLYQL